MAVDYRFKFPLPNGLHARPASHFEELTSRFRSTITLIHERTLVRANTRSVLSMVSADVKYDDPCCIHVVGEDEQPALEAVRRFLKGSLLRCDQPLPEIPKAVVDTELPRSLKAAGLKNHVRGKAVSGGVGWGEAVFAGGVAMPKLLDSNEIASDPTREKQRALDAIAAVRSVLSEKINAASHQQEAQVLKAHAAIVRDVGLTETICDLITAKSRTAAQAIVEACGTFIQTLQNAQSEYLRERVLDVEDVCVQLLDQVVKHNGTPKISCRVIPSLTKPSVCVANHLTPGQFLSLDRRHLKGLVLAEGGTTSHTVILARSMNVPTLVAVPRPAGLRAGSEILVDGELGILVTELTEPLRRYYQIERERIENRQRKLDSFRELDGKTADQHPLEVGANIAGADEAVSAFECGAQGIGLFRTEILFMDRDTAPSEQEQTSAYSTVAREGGVRPVIIRLLDLGGDKPAPYLKLPVEDNPFLGFRGARIYRELSPLVKTQMRAVLRAAAVGNVKILVPMICCIEEVRQIKQMLSEAAEELTAEGFHGEKLPPLGVMIEVPSLAFLMPELCAEVDFFSIGSNDLTQYFLAADRANQKVASLYTWSHPAFLRMLKGVVDEAHARGKWIGLCGEMADQSAALPVLVGLGLDEISVSPSRVVAIKAGIAASNFTHCRQLLDEAIKCATRGDVESMLQSSAALLHGAPLLPAAQILTSDAQTKEQVIKEMCDCLYVAGRVERPQLLEEAVWKREDTYSTGFGFGFALPHCKSEHLAANSIVIAKLVNPIVWGSLDGQPVDVVILLTIRSQEHARQHMQIFAKLSRMVMRDEFRDRIRGEQDPKQLASYLEQVLRPAPDAV